MSNCSHVCGCGVTKSFGKELFMRPMIGKSKTNKKRPNIQELLNLLKLMKTNINYK